MNIFTPNQKSFSLLARCQNVFTTLPEMDAQHPLIEDIKKHLQELDEAHINDYLLQKFDLKQGDILVIKYSPDLTDRDIQDLTNSLKYITQRLQICGLLIPNAANLEEFTKDDLTRMRNVIDEVLSRSSKESYFPKEGKYDLPHDYKEWLLSETTDTNHTTLVAQKGDMIEEVSGNDSTQKLFEYLKERVDDREKTINESTNI